MVHILFLRLCLVDQRVSLGYDGIMDGETIAMGVTPKWLVYSMENPNLKWNLTRGTPISGNHHMRKMIDGSMKMIYIYIHIYICIYNNIIYIYISLIYD